MATGAKLYAFEGHEAPVHSICPHSRETVHVRSPIGHSFSADICHFFFFASPGFSHSLLIFSIFYAPVCLFNVTGRENKGMVTWRDGI